MAALYALGGSQSLEPQGQVGHQHQAPHRQEAGVQVHGSSFSPLFPPHGASASDQIDNQHGGRVPNTECPRASTASAASQTSQAWQNIFVSWSRLALPVQQLQEAQNAVLFAKRQPRNGENLLIPFQSSRIKWGWGEEEVRISFPILERSEQVHIHKTRQVHKGALSLSLSLPSTRHWLVFGYLIQTRVAQGERISTEAFPSSDGMVVISMKHFHDCC